MDAEDVVSEGGVSADYTRDPDAIFAQSLARIRDTADLSLLPEDVRDLGARVVHACGIAEALTDLRWSDGAGTAGRAALARRATVLVDSQMLLHGIDRVRLLPSRVMCTLGIGASRGIARRSGSTRSAAAVELWPPWLGGAVVVIGTAPTALFRLLEGLAGGWPRPAVILGFPVGFVGADEAKQALVTQAGDIPYVTLLGRLGGSAVAAAAVNALAR